MKRRKSENLKGQGMVEFALTIPIILFLVLGIIEFGWLLFVYTSVSAAGREAARYGAGIGQLDSSDPTALYNDCDGIRAAAMRIGLFAGVEADDIEIFHDAGPDSTPVPYCRSGDGPIVINLGDRIVVNVATFYHPLASFVPIPDMTLRSQSAHTLVKEAPVIAYTPQVISVGETCDNTSYDIEVDNPLGPVVKVTLTNSKSPFEVANINNILVVWDPTSSPVLNRITNAAGADVIYPMNAPAPTYSKDVSWNFNSGVTVTRKLVFSKALKNNVIVRLTLDNGCTFGK